MLSVIATLLLIFGALLVSWVGLQSMRFLAYLTEITEIDSHAIIEALTLLQQGRANDAKIILEDSLTRSIKCAEKFYSKNPHFKKTNVK